MTDLTVPSERHYRFHLWRMALGLAFSVAYGVGTILVLVRPGIQLSLILAPALVFIASVIALNVALRGRRWWRPDAEDRVISKDEWVTTNMNRARRLALAAVCFVQAPLQFFVVYIQPDPPTIGEAVAAMAALTFVTAGTTFFASYLQRGWTHAHG